MNSSVQATVERVRFWLHELFGQRRVVPYGENSFWMLAGSTVVHVSVLPYGDERPTESVISVWSRVTVGTPLTPKLALWLIKENMLFRFGAFGYIEDEEDPNNSAVAFRFNLLGGSTTKEELMVAVMAVAATSDRYDDQIAQRFGGKTMREILEQPTPEEEDEFWE